MLQGGRENGEHLAVEIVDGSGGEDEGADGPAEAARGLGRVERVRIAVDGELGTITRERGRGVDESLSEARVESQRW
jgi:hypothetical protein